MKTEIQPVYSSVEVLQMTGTYTRHCIENNILGDLVECGVAAGSQIAMMQKTLVELNASRTIWGFDSFQGIPYATDKDETQPGIGEVDKAKYGALETTGVASHSVEDVQKNFERYGLKMDNVNLIEGWFEQTIEANFNRIESIAMLRLDGDLYRSTKVCLFWLLEKLSPGGVLIIDDYQLPGCAKAVHEFINPAQIVIENGVGVYIKP